MPRVRTSVKQVAALPPSLTRWPGYVMRHVFNAWYLRYEAEVAAVVGLSVNALIVLVTLAAEGAGTQANLAARIGIDRSTMVAVIDELESRGFVERRRGEGDRRTVPIHITDAGQLAAQESSELTDASNDHVFSGFTAEERDAFATMLARMADTLAADSADAGAAPSPDGRSQPPSR